MKRELHLLCVALAAADPLLLDLEPPSCPASCVVRTESRCDPVPAAAFELGGDDVHRRLFQFDPVQALGSWKLFDAVGGVFERWSDYVREAMTLLSNLLFVALFAASQRL